jgi:hypothetical protein
MMLAQQQAQAAMAAQSGQIIGPDGMPMVSAPDIGLVQC